VRNNTSQASEWDLELSFPRLGQVALFQLSNASDKRTPWARREAGAEIPIPQWEIARRLPTFRLLLASQEEHSIYLRIVSRTVIQLPLTLRSLSNAVHTAELQSLGWGFFYGMLLLATACFLFLYFSFWDRSYVYFASVIGCYCLFQSTVDGWNFKYLWPESPWLNDVGRLGDEQLGLHAARVLPHRARDRLREVGLAVLDEPPQVTVGEDPDQAAVGCDDQVDLKNARRPVPGNVSLLTKTAPSFQSATHDSDQPGNHQRPPACNFQRRSPRHVECSALLPHHHS
jgi:hypothetical protein